jgi:hypothetical protein
LNGLVRHLKLNTTVKCKSIKHEPWQITNNY